MMLVLFSEPAALIIGAGAIGEIGDRKQYVWQTTGSLSILTVEPDIPALVESTDIFGVVRFHILATRGAGWRVVSLRTPQGWLPIRWLILWE